ncbi:MAG: polyphosphate polymerase domain-containing protein [Bacteroidales bacterium]|nr:polyphosphate polymerase domain-containing protein [Bacteroidales bacterium]
MPTTAHISFAGALEKLQPITLAEMDAIKLMNRIDSKYLTTEAVLLQVLERAAAAGYRVLVTEGERISPYDSVYFDTPELGMFYAHRNRRLVRQKVRTRCYVNSCAAFLEIKRKNNKGRTKKKRTAIPTTELMDFSTDPAACDYLASHSWFRAAEISPVLETGFSRITLVNPEKTERITVDTCLEFRNFRSGHSAGLQDAVVIEVKQDGRAASRMRGIFLDLRVKPARISKYCVALTLTDPGARPGRFKEKVRLIEKTIGNKIVTI